jgi:hypothetical protein
VNARLDERHVGLRIGKRLRRGPDQRFVDGNGFNRGTLRRMRFVQPLSDGPHVLAVTLHHRANLLALRIGELELRQREPAAAGASRTKPAAAATPLLVLRQCGRPEAGGEQRRARRQCNRGTKTSNH